MLDNNNSIYQYLHYGYLVPDKLKMPVRLPNDQERVDYGALINSTDICKLISIGTSKLNSAFMETYASVSSSPLHIVPLSGGLDSRAILAWLIENIELSKIVTVTFGTPNTLDFELGKLVSRQAGVKNEAIDLSLTEWATEDIVSFGRLCERPVPLFEAYLFHRIRALFNNTAAVYWSGFMGEALTGSHLPKESSATWEYAQDRFARWNNIVPSVNLRNSSFRPETCLPTAPIVDQNVLSYDEQLDFGVRQQNYIRPLVLLKGVAYCTPFLHPEWTKFILSVPRSLREKQALYKEILKSAYPKLFSLPTKTNAGLPLDASVWRKVFQIGKLRTLAAARRFLPQFNWPVSPGINYIDFDKGIRERPDLKQVVYENIQDLKRRGIVDWIDIDGIWQRHQRKEANHADALTILASLEIFLKLQSFTNMN